jgi:hypothetical protein
VEGDSTLIRPKTVSMGELSTHTSEISHDTIGKVLLSQNTMAKLTSFTHIDVLIISIPSSSKTEEDIRGKTSVYLKGNQHFLS